MKILRLLLAVVVATYMTGGGRVLAQDANTSGFSLSLAPVQYADVKGNVGKFEALNWMPSGADEGFSDISFVKDINKNISLDIEGSAFPNTNNYDDDLVLKDGDIAFLKIGYKSFRKYYDGTGGIYPYTDEKWSTTKPVSKTPEGLDPAIDQGAQANSPNLQMDISYFKLEAGLGEISDPFIDITYEHNVKDGDKSLLQWGAAYSALSTSTYELIAPSWESVNDTADIVTLKEKKELLGVTIKADQTAEVDYNHQVLYIETLNSANTSVPNQFNSVDDSPNAKLFGSGIRFEKWMLNDSTYAALGYHYNHTSAADANIETEQKTVNGVISTIGAAPSHPPGTTLWNEAKASADDHVWVGNFNSTLLPNLSLIGDVRYEHMGEDSSSNFFPTSTASGPNTAASVDVSTNTNHEDQEGEHLGLNYYGLSHTTLYLESEMQQDRNLNNDTYTVTTGTPANWVLDRLERDQENSWTAGGRIVPNRFFIFSTQVKQHWQNENYDNIYSSGNSGLLLLDALKENGIDETSTLTWKPYRWLQNSLKYQFSDTVYNPLATEGTTNGYPISENHMLSSTFTYDITVQPIDPVLVMLSYSHVENYVRTLAAASGGAAALPTSGTALYIPDFNSGDNSWLFSTTYSPLDNLSWTNSVCYTLSDNYVDYSSGLPLGTNFKMLNLSTGLDWTFHKWLTISPKYEHASYRDNPLAGVGNYSANIFTLEAKFKW